MAHTASTRPAAWGALLPIEGPLNSFQIVSNPGFSHYPIVTRNELPSTSGRTGTVFLLKEVKGPPRRRRKPVGGCRHGESFCSRSQDASRLSGLLARSTKQGVADQPVGESEAATTSELSSSGRGTLERRKSSGRQLKLTPRGIVWSDDGLETLLDGARKQLGPWHAEMQRWRRQIHMQPELAFQEHATSDLVAEKLAEWGYKVDRSMGGTGVVGTLTAGEAPPGTAIMLRADMDALPIEEENTFEHRSVKEATMHACGHDGHTAMLLGAARYLAEHRPFQGTVHLLFQPAEEGTPTENEGGRKGGGAAAMMEEGLFEKYPVRAAFGMHNWPGLPVGKFAVHSGPVMAAVDTWTMEVWGIGCHAAMPHLGEGKDAILCAASIVTAFQTLVSRRVAPHDSAVVSVTQIHGGDASNVLPEKVWLNGTVRTYLEGTRRTVREGMAQIAQSTAAAYGCEAQVSWEDYFPATINTREEAQLCAEVAAEVAGKERVSLDTVPPSMGAEDFGFILQHVPGCYLWIGNGPTEGGCMLHNPRYDFNDDILALGASFWVKLVERALPKPEG